MLPFQPYAQGQGPAYSAPQAIEKGRAIFGRVYTEIAELCGCNELGKLTIVLGIL